MHSTRFDQLTRILAGRHSRRSALGLAAGVGTALLGRAAIAQDATPAASPATLPDNPHPSADTAGVDAEFLFVQPFERGTWAPKAGERDVYTLTLTGAAAQTTYFSDRPERIVGLAPTQAFLDGLGFPPTDPPNAALVATTGDGATEDVLVVELLNPVYDAGSGTLTYDARVLADYAEAGLAHLARQQTDYAFPASFGEGSLFIDDCPDQKAACEISESGCWGNITYGTCWSWKSLDCLPCDDAYTLSSQCNDTFSNCNGECVADTGYHCDT